MSGPGRRAAPGLASTCGVLVTALVLAGCPPPDADYQHVSDTAQVREEHPGRIAAPNDSLQFERVPHGTAAGDTTGRRDPHDSPLTGTLSTPPDTGQEQRPPNP